MTGTAWWCVGELAPEQRAEALVRSWSWCHDQLAARRAAYVEHLGRYHRARLRHVYGYGYWSAVASAPPPQATNEARDPVAPWEKALVDTLRSQIAESQRPRPSFLTRDADWQTRRKARWIDRAVEAVLRAPQGPYADGWDLVSDVMTDALIGGVGCVRVRADDAAGEVRLERVEALTEIAVDPEDARYRDPRMIYQRSHASRAAIIEAYAADDDDDTKRLRAAIESAPTATGSSMEPGADRHDHVYVHEAWRAARPGSPGRYLVVCGRAVLVDVEYDSAAAPFVFLRWCPDRLGFWGSGIVDDVWSLSDLYNDLYARLMSRARLCSGKRTYFERGSVSESAMAANGEEVLIEVEPGMRYPQEVPPQAFTPAELQLLEHTRSVIHDVSGVSEAAVTARKDPGVTAAVAMREMGNAQSRRFAQHVRAYELVFVQLGRRITEALDSLGSASVVWSSSRYARQISWPAVRLDPQSLVVQVAPVSALPHDPAGRIQMAQELRNAGDISPTTFKRLIGWADLERELSHENAEYEFVESMIERFLDAEEDDAADAYEPPEAFLLSIESAILQVTGAYYQARLDSAPEHVLDLFRRWITDADALVARREAPDAAAEALAQAPAMPGPVEAGAMPPVGIS